MTNRKPQKIVYVSPRALRLENIQSGRGGWPDDWCKPGSGDTDGCAMNVNTAVGNCAENGNIPTGLCSNNGNGG